MIVFTDLKCYLSVYRKQYQEDPKFSIAAAYNMLTVPAELLRDRLFE